MLFSTGLVLLVYEVIWRHGNDSGVLTVCVSLLLFPPVLGIGDRRRDRDDDR